MSRPSTIGRLARLGRKAPSGGTGTSWELLKSCLPNDHSRQVTSRDLVESVMSQKQPPQTVVDLGCGKGDSIKLFRKLRKGVQWIGIDIIGSPESRARTRKNAPLVYYDGVGIPLASDSVDLVYSHQVFEHVRHPDLSLHSIARVLKPGGCLVGSTSQFEAYHSFSYWNYTPFGFKTLVEDAGLEMKEMRPGIDGISLIARAFFNRHAFFSSFFSGESPLNLLIDGWGASSRRSAAQVNHRKLTYCGQFTFWATKP